MPSILTMLGGIRRSGVTIENEPIIKSDGSGEIMQWQPSDGGADGIYITEGGSAEQPRFPKHPDNMMHLASVVIPPIGC